MNRVRLIAVLLPVALSLQVGAAQGPSVTAPLQARVDGPVMWFNTLVTRHASIFVAEVQDVHILGSRPGYTIATSHVRVSRILKDDRVLPRGTTIPHPGRTRLAFGDPIRQEGEEPRRLAHELEEVLQAL